MLRGKLATWRAYRRGKAALRYAERRRAPGAAFGRFGRRVGWRLLLRGSRKGLGYLLTPVNIVRYFEFPFAWSHLPRPPGRARWRARREVRRLPAPGKWLDVGSPRLFSLYVASRRPSVSVTMMNPSASDISATERIVAALGFGNIVTERAGADAVAGREARYDCIWAISVVEHISGEYDDTDAVRGMYDSLREGGRLILTVPVARSFAEEFRDRDRYGLGQPREDGLYFFQRTYDMEAVRNRLIAPTGERPAVVRWFGEKSPGRYAAYVRRWTREGHACTVEDPREIADHYREFPSWEEMPGMGVCGIVIEKTKRGGQRHGH